MRTLLEILEDMFPGVDVRHCNEFVDGNLMDSDDMMTLADEISDNFGVEIPEEEMTPDNFNSAKALYNLIERLQEN